MCHVGKFTAAEILTEVRRRMITIASWGMWRRDENSNWARLGQGWVEEKAGLDGGQSCLEDRGGRRIGKAGLALGWTENKIIWKEDRAWLRPRWMVDKAGWWEKLDDGQMDKAGRWTNGHSWMVNKWTKLDDGQMDKTGW